MCVCVLPWAYLERSSLNLEEPNTFAGRLHRMIKLRLSIDDDGDEEGMPELEDSTTHSALLHSVLYSLLEVLECTQHSVHRES
jgi:hypothetical protein